MHCSPAARKAQDAELALARALRRDQLAEFVPDDTDTAAGFVVPAETTGPLCAAMHQEPLALGILEYLDVGKDIVRLCFRVSGDIADCVEPVVAQLLRRVAVRAMARIPFGMIGTLFRSLARFA